MGKENVKNMFVKIEKDENLKKDYFGLLKAHQIESEKILAEMLTEFGKAAGFSFSKEELLAARAEVIDKINGNNELLDKDLAAVAGGGSQKGTAIFLSMATFGGGCAIVSIAAEVLKNQNMQSCKAHLTADPNHSYCK